jgi:hypothetical protein
MTRFVGTPLTGVEFRNLGDEAFSARTTGDASPRLRIDAGGRITWSAGSSAGDVNLYRSGSNTLSTDDIFYAPAGIVTLTTEGAPSQNIPDGAVAVDTENDVLYFRSQDEWIKSSTSIVVISETEPQTGRNGDLWFTPIGDILYIYNVDEWVSIAGEGLNLSGLLDVEISSPQEGQALRYNENTQTWRNEELISGDGGTPTSWKRLSVALDAGGV